MGNSALTLAADHEAESRARGLLADAERARDSVGAVLPHLLGGSVENAFSERVVAQVRSQLLDVARQLEGIGFPGDRIALASHVHALAVEAELLDRMAYNLGIDPVIPPLLQDQDGAAKVIAVQARFIQDARRGLLPLGELPADLLGSIPQAAPNARLALIGHFIDGLPPDAHLLDPLRAGISLFASAISRASGEPRDDLLVALGGGQTTRPALALRACGLSAPAIEACLFALCPERPLPEELLELLPQRAAEMLAR